MTATSNSASYFERISSSISITPVSSAQALSPSSSSFVMVLATTEVPTETEMVLNGQTITVTTVVPTT